jgi:DNA repair exonuclease SbcCD ATPase subunit
MRKQDKRATSQVIAHNNARKGAANVSKKLIKSNAHDDLTKLVAQIRAFHRDQTVPWGDLGDRLIANEALIDYRNNMAQLEEEFWDLAEQTQAEYPQAVAQAQLQQTGLGHMFNEAEYPSVEQLRRKFKFALTFEAVPDVGDFRVDIGNQAAEEMREQYKQVLESRINSVKQDLAERLAEPLQRMSKGLDYAEGEKPTGFRDTLVSNVLAITELMRTCNLSNDARLTDVQQQLRQTLTGVTPDGLRRDPHLRAKTKQDVDQIIKNLPSLGF